MLPPPGMAPTPTNGLNTGAAPPPPPLPPGMAPPGMMPPGVFPVRWMYFVDLSLAHFMTVFVAVYLFVTYLIRTANLLFSTLAS